MDLWKILNDKFVSLLIRIMTTDVLFFIIMIGYYKGASGELQSFLYCEW